MVWIKFCRNIDSIMKALRVCSLHKVHTSLILYESIVPLRQTAYRNISKHSTLVLCYMVHYICWCFVTGNFLLTSISHRDFFYSYVQFLLDEVFWLAF